MQEIDKKRIILGADHAGFEHKEKIKSWLMELGYEVDDMGAYGFDAKDDYPDFIAAVAYRVNMNQVDRCGIVFGKSGQGEAIVANRFKNVRAVAYYGFNLEVLKLSRQDNGANVLSIGAAFVSVGEAKTAILAWLGTDFSREERHKRRIAKLCFTPYPSSF